MVTTRQELRWTTPKDKPIMEQGNERLVDTIGPLSPTLTSLERRGHLPSRGIRFLFLIYPDGSV